MTLSAGAPAPDFTLRDQHGRPTSSASLRGHPALLVFFPFAFSSVCTGELAELRDHAGRLADAQVVGISCDPMFTLRAFADRDGLEMPLLSDFWPHGEVARAYGVLDPNLGCPTRSSYLVDADGTVRWSVHNPMGEARRIDDYVREIEALRIRR